jgi:hypothetical protein
MHVAQISFFNDPAGRLPEELLVAWPSLVDVADAACQAGARVSVVQACAHVEHLERRGVRYYFLPFGQSSPTGAHNRALGELLRTLAPDVCHVHGLGFHQDVLALAAMVSRIPIVLQAPVAASAVATRNVRRFRNHILLIGAGAAVRRCRSH